MKSLLSAFMFIGMFAAGIGYFNFFKAKESPVGRDPAAAYGAFDLSSLKGVSLDAAIRQRILKGLEVYKDEQNLNFEVANFVFENGAGEKKFACEAYSKIAVSFIAEGASVAGEKPVMKVVGNCQNDIESARILPFRVPLEVLSMQSPADGDLVLGEGYASEVSLKHMPDHWPKLWVLQSVELMNSDGDGQLQVKHSEVSQILGRPFVLSF